MLMYIILNIKKIINLIISISNFFYFLIINFISLDLHWLTKIIWLIKIAAIPINLFIYSLDLDFITLNIAPPTPSPTASNASFETMVDTIGWSMKGDIGEDTITPDSIDALNHAGLNLTVDTETNSVKYTWVSEQGYIFGSKELEGHDWLSYKIELILNVNGTFLKATPPRKWFYRTIRYFKIDFRLV